MTDREMLRNPLAFRPGAIFSRFGLAGDDEVEKVVP